MNLEDRIEAAYWEFDARKKGYPPFQQESERDAFKHTVRKLIDGMTYDEWSGITREVWAEHLRQSAKGFTADGKGNLVRLLPDQARAIADLLAAPGREGAVLDEVVRLLEADYERRKKDHPDSYESGILDGYDLAIQIIAQVRKRSAAVAAALAAPGKPIGYLAAYELDRLRSGHDARLRSPLCGPSELDCDVPVYAAPPDEPTAGREGAAETALRRVLDVVQRYLPPDGIGKDEALNEIIGIVDPWPLAAPPDEPTAGRKEPQS